MSDKEKIEILGMGTNYSFPVTTGRLKGSTASLKLVPKLGANLSIKFEGKSTVPDMHFKSLKGASKIFKGLTEVDVEGIPPLTKGQYCKCGKASRPTNITNLRTSGPDRERLACLRCGGKIRGNKK